MNARCQRCGTAGGEQKIVPDQKQAALTRWLIHRLQPLATTSTEGVGQAIPNFVVTFVQSGFDQALTGFKVHASNVFSATGRLIVHFAMPLANVSVYLGHPGETFLSDSRSMMTRGTGLVGYTSARSAPRPRRPVLERDA